MANTRWKILTFEGAITHLCCIGLEHDIINDMVARGCKLEKSKSTKTFNIDMPGMICIDRPWETFMFRGLTLKIPSEDILMFMVNLEALQVRQLNNKSYYKLHGFLRCLVLTATQRDGLLRLLKLRCATAEQKAAEFWATRKTPSEVLREMAAKTTGQPLEKIPNLGGNKNDRFILKNKGNA